MPTRKVVLVGAGHAHLHLAKHAETFRSEGVEVTLVDPGTFWYSGLATGMLGGAYERQEDQVDPAKLIESQGGRFISDRAVGIDRAAQRLTLASGDALAYDAVSFNVGSRVPIETLDGATHEGVTPVKPIANLWRLREQIEARFGEQRDNGNDVENGDDVRRVTIVVIGGGATGCEVAANLTELARRRGGDAAIRLITGSERLLTSHSPGASRSITRALHRRNVEIVFGKRAKKIEPGRLFLSGGDEDGDALPCEVVVVAIGLVPSSLKRELDLPLDDEGGLRVGATLQSVDDPRVFAGGDCASLEGHTLPKVGVFGVRQAPVLLHNLVALLTDQPLKKYRPQKQYLTILNLGLGEGLALRGRWHWRGRLSLWLKEWIDRRWIRQYRI